MSRTLDSVRVGEKTKVVAIGGEHTSLRRRLLDMGMTPGTEIHLMRVAPFGDPMEIEVRGYSLTLRKEDASIIEVA